MDPKFSMFKACAFCHSNCVDWGKINTDGSAQFDSPTPPPLIYQMSNNWSVQEVGGEEDLSLVLLDICINKASSAEKRAGSSQTWSLKENASRPRQDPQVAG